MCDTRTTNGILWLRLSFHSIFRAVLLGFGLELVIFSVPEMFTCWGNHFPSFIVFKQTQADLMSCLDEHPVGKAHTVQEQPLSQCCRRCWCHVSTACRGTKGNPGKHPCGQGTLLLLAYPRSHSQGAILQQNCQPLQV